MAAEQGAASGQENPSVHMGARRFHHEANREAASVDGYSVTVELDCGCTFRVNENPAVPSFKVGDWSSCWQHSKIYGYDPSTGEPKYDRDRRVVAVRRD